MPVTKIATCCYCGSKTALRLRGKERHELACASCAAPLHYLKAFPMTPDRAVTPASASVRPTAHPKPGPRRPAKRRNLGRFARKLMSELWDELEDIFD